MNVLKNTDTIDDKTLHYYATRVVEKSMDMDYAVSCIKKMAKGKFKGLTAEVKTSIENRFQQALNSMHRVRRLIRKVN